MITKGTDAEIERVVDLVSRWLASFNRSFTTPTKSQVAEITSLLSQLEEPLGKLRLLDELRFCLPTDGAGGQR